MPENPEDCEVRSLSAAEVAEAGRTPRARAKTSAILSKRSTEGGDSGRGRADKPGALCGYGWIFTEDFCRSGDGKEIAYGKVSGMEVRLGSVGCGGGRAAT